MKNQFKNLVFEGGGVKGIAYGGALTKLDELGVFSNIERVAGTSAGAITATLMAIGYSAQEISDIISKTNFQDFADDDEGWFKDIYRLFVYFGWHKGDKLKQWISDHLLMKFNKPDLSFQELKSLSLRAERKNSSLRGAEGDVAIHPQIRDLYITGSNLTTHKSEVYSYETTPDMQIRDAVRISMSIPFFFQAVINKAGDTLVDGGVIRNYPINIFDNKKYLHSQSWQESETKASLRGAEGDVAIQTLESPLQAKITNSNYIHNPETLGFRLADKNTVEGGTQKLKITGIKSFAMSLITFMQAAACKTHINQNDRQKDRTV